MLGAAGFIIAVAIWAVAAMAMSGGQRAFPGPVEVAVALGGQLGEPGFWKLLWDTTWLWFLGMLAVTAIAIPLGILIGLNPAVRAWTRSTLDALRSLPHVALIPILLIVMGTNPPMVISMVVLGATWPLLFQTIAGVLSIDSVTKDSARIMHLGAWERFRSIYIPGAMPFVVTGLRVAAALALILVVVTGMLAATPGLGLGITQAQEGFRTELLYAYILVVGVLGVGLVGAFHLLERRVLAWQNP